MELEDLPEENPFRANLLEWVYNLLTLLAIRQQQEQDLDEEEQELIMQLSPLYLQRLEEERLQERRSERRSTINSLLKIRFGTIDPELEGIIDALIQFSPEEFTPLLWQLSREELLARFGGLN